jgi:hypothetical protein
VVTRLGTPDKLGPVAHETYRRQLDDGAMRLLARETLTREALPVLAEPRSRAAAPSVRASLVERKPA